MFPLSAGVAVAGAASHGNSYILIGHRYMQPAQLLQQGTLILRFRLLFLLACSTTRTSLYDAFVYTLRSDRPHEPVTRQYYVRISTAIL